MFKFAVAILAAACAVSAENIYIQVHNNASATDGTTVFVPQSVKAKINDVVFFNFTEGNHTVSAADFSAPCVPIGLHDPSLNGFTTGEQIVANNSFKQSSVAILASNVNNTIWFFDFNTCAIGGVGGINVNESSTETLDGFIRNAERLNSSTTTTSTTSQPSTTSPSSTGSAASTSSTGAAGGAAHLTLSSAALVVPVLLVAIVL